ncbi:hypothetical protein PCANC_08265 [Puccinia coronata f. sp. avenae]|uniref:Uncharacterized protein n=1 Tax=Puccinia coronata f. sp. avenae TaxID=200324 RepID=A0A2N5T5Q8_9BASI|nr:hypothetical protein PCANC_08265 [Puccinia coronata f. sp. avenae]
MASSLNLTDILVHEFNGSQSNPFIILIHNLNAKKNPPVDATQSTTLLLSVVTYNVIILVCLGIIFLPYLQGKGTKNRRHWIVKRRYLDGHRQPYWIPNSGLIVAASHLLGSTLFLVFLGLRYRAFQTGVPVESFYGTAWLELRWFPGYCSFFSQAWSTWFVRASDATVRGKRSGIHPVAFNLNLIVLPTTALVTALFLVSAQAAAMDAEAVSFKTMMESLILVSHQWYPGQTSFNSPQFLLASTTFASYGVKSDQLLSRFRTTGLFWTFVAVPTLIFYMFGISTLLRVMYKRFRAVKREAVDSDICSTISSSDSFRKRLKNTASHQQNMANQLPTSFFYLGVHYTMMSLILCYHIVIGLIFYLSDNTAMFQDKFLGLFMVLSNSGSYLLLAALLVQLLRIMLEGKEQARKVSSKIEKHFEYENHALEDSKKSHQDIKLMT